MPQTAESSDPLAEVGVPDPGGQPAVQRQYADGWAELAAGLREHQQQLEALLARAPQWEDQTSADFLGNLAALAESGGQAAETAEGTAGAQQEHADSHERALEILKELAIQIAVTLAFIAAAVLFPMAVAAAHAQLVLLAQTAGRVVSLLARLLGGLERALVSARGALEGLSQLTFRTENVAIGYGRFLADGVRDFTIDLLANTTTSAILHKPLTAESLLTSAGVSFGVGGLVGGLEHSGAKKLLDAAGDVRRNADGKPEFALLGQRYRRTAETLGDSLLSKTGKSGGTGGTGGTGAGTAGAGAAGGAVDVPGTGALTGKAALDAARAANMQAGRLGVRIGSAEGRRLAAALDTAGARRAAAQAAESAGRADRLEAEQLVRHTGDDVASARDLVSRTGSALEDALRLRDAHAAGGDAARLRDAEGRVTEATGRFAQAQQHLADARGVHERAQRAGDLANRLAAGHEARAALATDAHRAADERLTAWRDMASSATHARTVTSAGERFSHALRHNAYRASFGSPRGWRSAVLYDGVKDGTKGFLSNLVQAGIAAGQGGGDADSVWKEALLGAAGGATRGVLKGRMTNVAFPGGGVEEILWKSGTKGLDKFTRDQILEAIEPQEPAPAEPEPAPAGPAPGPGAAAPPAVRPATTSEPFPAPPPSDDAQPGTDRPGHG